MLPHRYTGCPEDVQGLLGNRNRPRRMQVASAGVGYVCPKRPSIRVGDSVTTHPIPYAPGGTGGRTVGNSPIYLSLRCANPVSSRATPALHTYGL